MVLFIILGVVVVLAIVFLGVLFFMLDKEADKDGKQTIAPLINPEEIKKELSPDPLKSSISSGFESTFSMPRVTLPTQESKTPLENDAYKKQAQELEEELTAISKKAEDQSSEAKQMIADLTKENELLKSQRADLEQAQQKLDEMESEASSLKIENAGLQTQLQTTNAKMRLLDEQMTAVKLQMGEELSRANAAVSELNREKEAWVAAPKADPDEGVRQELEALKAEQVQLKQKGEELESSCQKLRELNTHLMEKNDALQYELVKARAQSSGLERVSLNYKNQLEDFLKKVDAAQAVNEQLTEVKSRLESMVEEVKLQNEELVKKNQLSQFELEKNRSRLASLEHECEGLKARVQQQDQQ